MGRLKEIKGKLTQFQRYSFLLLANGIRKAERVDIAMESKGFTGDQERTYYHQMTVIKRDWLFSHYDGRGIFHCCRVVISVRLPEDI